MKYKIREIAPMSSQTVNPQNEPNTVWHLYSLPSFDAGKREEIMGKEILSNKFVVPHRCILFNKLNVRFKRVWRINCDEDHLIASTEFLPLVPNEELVDYNYLYHYLISDKIANYFNNQNSNTSGSHKRIDVDLFLDMEIDLPPMDIQRKIGKFISINDKIALNTRMNTELETMAKQLYDYWFVQFDFPDENGKPYKSSGGKMVYNEKLKREIPEGWESSILLDIANITMGQSPDGSSYNENGKGIIFYQGSSDFGIRFPSVRMFTTEPSRFASKGDILMSVRAPVGDTNIANTDCCIGRGLAALNSKINSITYLYFILGYLKSKFDVLNSIGTTFGAITKDELFSLPVVKPNSHILQKFEDICSPIFDEQMKIGYEIEELNRLRDSLLPLLMNGQVTVE
jgi:type I restriction enzyme S subunit